MVIYDIFSKHTITLYCKNKDIGIKKVHHSIFSIKYYDKQKQSNVP